MGTSYTRRAGYDIVGADGQTLSDKWADGLKTMHGLMTSGFPNCFFLGFTQTAVTVNIPHALNEQAKHVRHILTEARQRGAAVVEAAPEGERAWVDEMHSKARLGARFYAECTPGYYNNEGKIGPEGGFWANSYGAGSVRFFKILAQWREDGGLPGLDLR